MRCRARSSFAKAAVAGAFGMLLLPAVAAAQGGRFALVVQGVSGDETYAKQHRDWTDGLVAVLRDRFRYPSANVVVLSEAAEGPLRSTAENVRAAVTRLATTMTASDQLVMVLIGHGTADAADAKFNLVGPDLGVAEWKTLVSRLPGRLAVVDTTSGSFPFLAGLAAPGRVVVTATNSASQRFHTTFPDAFLKSLTAAEADADKNGRLSILEAFNHASRAVKQHYEQNGTMATETAVLDDDGDGKGRLATAEGPDGAVAALTYLDPPAVIATSDPELQKLLVRQQALTDQIDDLRRRRATLAEADFNKQLEALIVELAEVSSQARRRQAN
jgi:hypothetical protein